MKLCVSTLGCCEWSLNKFVGFLKDLGVSGLGIRGLDNIMDTNKFDCLKNENELTDFGKGEIPIKKIISMLKADGYDGYTYPLSTSANGILSFSAPEIAFPEFVNYIKNIIE